MTLEFRRIHFRKRKNVAVAAEVCSGCRICEVVCTLKHERVVNPELSRIFVRSNTFNGSFVPIVCRQCSDAPCFYACSESAITIDESIGTVLIHEEKCTGCRACEEACPFGAIRFDSEKCLVFKCDFCQGDPECVKWCPMNTLGITEFGREDLK